MSPWQPAIEILLVSLLPLLWIIQRGTNFDAVIGFEVFGVITTALFLLMAAAANDTALADPALVAAFLSFGGGLVYVHFFERWI